jgi:TolB-like protein/Flp pilus assembly protein TadD
MFIVMEYIDGRELREVIKSEIPNPKSAIDYATQIASGLQAAHEKGIIHRDIKSSNIMITPKGQVKIMDFGLAKMSGSLHMTKAGSTLGTPFYMSPEQTRGSDIDQRSDIWSFGVVLYEMLTGQMPFRGDYEQAIIYSILNEVPEAMADVSPELEQIVLKSLAKNPDERYPTAGEMAKELRTISEGGAVKRPGVKQSKLPWIMAATAVIVIALVLYLFLPNSKGGEETKTAEVKTIAILPFDDLSPKKDQGYFSDGLSEELINVLSRNKNLRVTAKTSSFSFKGKGFDIKTMAAKLNVKNILEGSVRKAGNNLRISADLVNVETDATLWSNSYDGTLNNIFALQDSISDNVAEALNAALLGKEAAKPEQKTDPEAYNNYLLGNHFFDLQSKENLMKAEEYYKKTLLIDSSYAPAWVGLSRVHSTQAGLAYIPVDEGYTEARNETEKALKLNPNLADVYAQIGQIKTNYGWDWSGANKAYKKGLELEPENTDVINGAARLAQTLGNLDEAIKLMHHVIEINPVSLDGYFDLGFYTWYAELPDESIAAYRKCLELTPQYPGAHLQIALDYIYKGDPDSALVEINQETETIWKIFGLPIIYNALGKKKESDEKLDVLIKGYQDVGAYQVAEVYAFRNEKEKAFKWMERAYKQRDTGIYRCKGDPLLRNIVNDPRYPAFLKKLKLPL